MDISITGPKILFEIPIFGTTIKITETIVNSWIIMLVLAVVVLFLTSNMKRVPGKKQLLAEMYVNFINGWVRDSMGEKCMSFAPYIGALFLFNIACNLSGLVGMRPPTTDLNTTLGWSLITAFLIHKTRLKKGVGNYVKGYFEPIFVMLPMNIMSELSTPVSMAFRQFGNLLSGTVVTTLVYSALAALTTAIFNIAVPFLQVGIPAVLSLYFDFFSGCIQAYIFSTLTMVFVAMEMDD